LKPAEIQSFDLDAAIDSPEQLPQRINLVQSFPKPNPVELCQQQWHLSFG